jgi:hypothetical protein
MVHALGEIRRILHPEGVLIDLRPMADRWPVQVVSGQSQREIGRLTDLPSGLADDEAACLAFKETARLGWFILENELSFPFYYYWETPEELREHMQEKWGDFLQLEEQVYSAAQNAWALSGLDRRLRVQVKMHIALLRKH